MLVNLREIVTPAYEGRYAVGSFIGCFVRSKISIENASA